MDCLHQADSIKLKHTEAENESRGIKLINTEKYWTLYQRRAKNKPKKGFTEPGDKDKMQCRNIFDQITAAGF